MSSSEGVRVPSPRRFEDDEQACAWDSVTSLARLTVSVTAIPDAYHDLFEKSTIAHLTTLNPDGSPHTTPVWIGYDADTDRLLVNTERGRRKERNVRERPDVSVSMIDAENPYRFLSVTGEVDEATTEGAREHIDELARRYTGGDYGNPIETERVLLRIRAEEVLKMD